LLKLGNLSSASFTSSMGAGSLAIGNTLGKGVIVAGLNRSPGGKGAPAADSGVAVICLWTIGLAAGSTARTGASVLGLVVNLLLVRICLWTLRLTGFAGYADGDSLVAGLEEIDLLALELWLAVGSAVCIIEASVLALAVDLLLV